MKIIPSWRKSNYLARFSVFLIMAALITGMPGSYGVGGHDNHPSQNLDISTWYGLDAIRDNLDGNHILMNDLDSTTPGYEELASPGANGGNGWQPIGYSTSVVVSCGGDYLLNHGLSGTLDGQRHEIRDLFINRPDEGAAGLLAYLMEGGIIKNVGVVNVTVISYNLVGSLVGENNRGTVSNCYAIGNVTGHAAIGGLVGRNIGNISNSYFTGSVSGESSTGIGGLVGQQHPGCTISNSYSTCSVAGNLHIGSGDPGGLVGDNGGTVSSSFWDTETSGQSTSDGGTGKNTTEMQDITTFSVAGWNIIAVGSPVERNPAYIWNIVDEQTYPFLSWQS